MPISARKDFPHFVIGGRSEIPIPLPDGAERLRLPGNTPLPHHQNIQGSVEDAGYFEGDRHAAARQCENSRAGIMDLFAHVPGKHPACLAPIAIRSLCVRHWENKAGGHGNASG